MIIKMSDEFRENWDYFAEFTTTFEDDFACLSLYSYFIARDIDNWNFRVIPKTDYHKELASFNRNPLDEFFEWFIARAVSKRWDTDSSGCFQRYGGEVISEFRIWRDEFGGKYD